VRSALDGPRGHRPVLLSSRDRKAGCFAEPEPEPDPGPGHIPSPLPYASGETTPAARVTTAPPRRSRPRAALARAFGANRQALRIAPA
jgi:hypothetical protein